MASYTDAIFMSAECLIKMTRVEDAVVLLNSLVSIYGQNAQDPGVFARLGELYHILGEES